IGAIEPVPREIGCVGTRAAAPVTDPVEAAVTVVRPTPAIPVSLSRSSRCNCETHAKDRQCCVLSTIQHGLISCGTHSAFELLVGQRRSGMNVCRLAVRWGLHG